MWYCFQLEEKTMTYIVSYVTNFRYYRTISYCEDVSACKYPREFYNLSNAITS